MLRTLTFLLALLSATPALAAADLRVTIPAPAAQYVGNTVSYSIVVANIGNKNVSSSSLIVQLPTTNTSPTVYVMGTLSAVDSRCALSGTRLLCSLGTINRNTSKTVTFGIALPEAAQTLSVTATGSTTSNENTLTNNVATNTPNLLNDAFSILNDAAAVNRRCTGTRRGSGAEPRRAFVHSTASGPAGGPRLSHPPPPSSSTLPPDAR